MKYLFFINPKAGKGNFQESICFDVEEYFKKNGGDYTVHFTRFAGDAEEKARKAAESGERIRMYACGGEGTCYEVLNGIIGYDNVELGVLPCGSANDFLKLFKNREPFSDISSQIAGKSVRIDVIKAGERYCMNSCSVGMDAMVARDMRLFKKLPLVGGSLAYKLAIAKNFLGRIGVNLEVSVDGRSFGKRNCLFALIANAPYYGGGYKGAPDAVPFDGKLNFTLVNKVSRLKILRFLPIYERGEHKNLDFCTMRECESMEFCADSPIPVNLDGEIKETAKMRFEIVRKAVSFILPEGIAELDDLCKDISKILINV